MSYCYNCGRPSHCGLEKYEEFWDWKDRHLGQIRICNNCICDDCTEKDDSKDDNEAVQRYSDKRKCLS